MQTICMRKSPTSVRGHALTRAIALPIALVLLSTVMSSLAAAHTLGESKNMYTRQKEALPALGDTDPSNYAEATDASVGLSPAMSKIEELSDLTSANISSMASPIQMLSNGMTTLLNNSDIGIQLSTYYEEINSTIQQIKRNLTAVDAPINNIYTVIDRHRESADVIERLLNNDAKAIRNSIELLDKNVSALDMSLYTLFNDLNTIEAQSGPSPCMSEFNQAYNSFKGIRFQLDKCINVSKRTIETLNHSLKIRNMCEKSKQEMTGFQDLIKTMDRYADEVLKSLNANGNMQPDFTNISIAIKQLGKQLKNSSDTVNEMGVLQNDFNSSIQKFGRKYPEPATTASASNQFESNKKEIINLIGSMNATMSKFNVLIQNIYSGVYSLVSQTNNDVQTILKGEEPQIPVPTNEMLDSFTNVESSLKGILSDIHNIVKNANISSTLREEMGKIKMLTEYMVNDKNRLIKDIQAYYDCDNLETKRQSNRKLNWDLKEARGFTEIIQKEFDDIFRWVGISMEDIQNLDNTTNVRINVRDEMKTIMDLIREVQPIRELPARIGDANNAISKLTKFSDEKKWLDAYTTINTEIESVGANLRNILSLIEKLPTPNNTSQPKIPTNGTQQPDIVSHNVTSINITSNNITSTNVSSANTSQRKIPTNGTQQPDIASHNMTSINITSNNVTSNNVTSTNVSSANTSQPKIPTNGTQQPDIASHNVTSINITSNNVTSNNVTSTNVSSANTSQPKIPPNGTTTNNSAKGGADRSNGCVLPLGTASAVPSWALIVSTTLVGVIMLC